MILILELGNAVSKGIFFRVKAPKRKSCNDVILAAIRQEPGIKVPKRQALKHVGFQSILLSKEPRGNKHFVRFSGSSSVQNPITFTSDVEQRKQSGKEVKDRTSIIVTKQRKTSQVFTPR